MDKKPAVSVVMPAYNSQDFLEESVGSVLAQDFGDWELIIVNDGSTDRTPEICASFSDDRIHCLHKPNGGVSSARNSGLALAKADIVCFLDADDLYSTDALSRYFEAFAVTPEPVMAYGEGRVLLHQEGELLEKGTSATRSRPRGDALEAFLFHNPVTTPGCMAAKRQAVEAAGGFDESLRFGEDWEFYTRLVALGPVVYLPGKEMVIYRMHSSSVARRLALDPTNDLPALEKAFAHAKRNGRLDPARLEELRRGRLASMYAYSGTENLKIGKYDTARKYLWQALRFRPLHAREWLLLACALVRWVPKWVRRRLK
ncbi:MAG: glycosyltransferase family 2 protein [Pseudodesulfovibrio sp.]|jgi:glycosyltransferase involved in cell wall biosynthesis|uniref:glycosyltransferase family 2 protein n=1 Tax=Pseudodesulfovibrio sp. TaxID=2035812 RepID=UPI003D11A05C